ncbi:MAG: ribosome small subunit-dependent GTPase A [Acidimicrobiia bacterium]|nr:ribosome small subunit-dependent GTPase A [Acidimicrobiia bacterium]
MTPRALGWTDRWQADFELLDRTETTTPARVLRHDGASVLVASQGTARSVPLRPAVPPLAVGDWITVDGDRVDALIDRKSLLQRRDPGTGLAQPIAANIDIIGIVCGVDRPLSIGRIERFSALAWDAGATPLVILSKSDLVDDTSQIESQIYSEVPGSDVIAVSASLALGIDELFAQSTGKTLVLVGESGAGKSTLVNAMAGEDAAATGSVRAGDHKGRHTTTSRQLHVLRDDCCLIDTPGVREVGLFTDVDTIDEGFDDVTSLADSCRFNDCNHETEPGCAVLEALADGSLSSDRVDSWRAFRREAASAELRSNQAAYRAEMRRMGKVYRGAMEVKRKRR